MTGPLGPKCIRPLSPEGAAGAHKGTLSQTARRRVRCRACGRRRRMSTPNGPASPGGGGRWAWRLPNGWAWVGDRCWRLAQPPFPVSPPPPPCDIPSGCCSFTGAPDIHPVFPSHVASDRCVLSAAAAGAPAGVVSAFAEPSSWCAGAVLNVAGCAVCASAAPSSCPSPPPPPLPATLFCLADSGWVALDREAEGGGSFGGGGGVPPPSLQTQTCPTATHTRTASAIHFCCSAPVAMLLDIRPVFFPYPRPRPQEFPSQNFTWDSDPGTIQRVAPCVSRSTEGYAFPFGVTVSWIAPFWNLRNGSKAKVCARALGNITGTTRDSWVRCLISTFRVPLVGSRVWRWQGSGSNSAHCGRQYGSCRVPATCGLWQRQQPPPPPV